MQWLIVTMIYELELGIHRNFIRQYDNKIIALLQFITFDFIGVIGRGKDYHITFCRISLKCHAVYLPMLVDQKRERSECFKAFLNNHYFGLGVFVAILVGFISMTVGLKMFSSYFYLWFLSTVLSTSGEIYRNLQNISSCS